MASKQARLKKARKTRSLISRDLQRLRTGVLNWEDVLRAPHRVLGRVQISTVMHAIPRVGDKKVRKVLTKTHVWPEDKLNQVPQEKRDEIADLLKEALRGE